LDNFDPTVVQLEVHSINQRNFTFKLSNSLKTFGKFTS